jgi:7,8-dihydropterin-6-yl-methyl-4-(beta-D-ribofuranosyl)aminobenzene 5'-phosphate synthase
MKLICLVDNCASGRFWGEHGLSFLIESEGQRTLWDTGTSGTVLLHNLAVAEVAPSSITALALSHGHYDHTGGLQVFLEQRPGLPLYAHPSVMRERFSRKGEMMNAIGFPMQGQRLRQRAELRLSAAPQEISPGIWTTGQIVARPEAEGRVEGHVVRQGDGFAPDPYEDDMALVLRGHDGLVLLCGCCHAGLLNTLYHVQATFGALPHTVIGGTHLIAANAQGVQHIAACLQQMGGLTLYPNHCTGQAAYVALAVALGSRVAPCPAGSAFTV